MSVICTLLDSKRPQSATLLSPWLMQTRWVYRPHVWVHVKREREKQRCNSVTSHIPKETHLRSEPHQDKWWRPGFPTQSLGLRQQINQLTIRSWVIFCRCLVWLVSLSKSAWGRRGWAGSADVNNGSWANRTEKSSEEEESSSTAEETKHWLVHVRTSYPRAHLLQIVAGSFRRKQRATVTCFHTRTA